jgi:hypothetical protein
MARTSFLHQPGRRLYVELEYNGVDLDELAADLARAGFSSVRVVEAIEETQHAHGWPLVLLGCLVRRGERLPGVGLPDRAPITDRVATATPTLAKQPGATGRRHPD